MANAVESIGGRPVSPTNSKSSQTSSNTGVSTAGPDKFPTPKLNNIYLTLRGYGPGRHDQISVMSGDAPPTVTGGYGKWQIIDRPLRTGVSVFQGYDPPSMAVSLRFLVWDASSGWDTSDSAGRSIEADIETLEWMAGAHFVAGQPPFVYVSSYGAAGGTTALVPSGYQSTAGASQLQDSTSWPWIIDGGIQWGKSFRNPSGYRIWQECTLKLTNFQSFSAPASSTQSGAYVTSSPGANTVLLIAGDSFALNVDQMATTIKNDPKNNPMAGSRTKLNSKSTRWPIPYGKSVWVPAHSI